MLLYNENDVMKNMPYLFLIRSDGGMDRNPKNASVQIGCINFFLENNLDLVIYLITAADISHVNEVEGVMPIANYVLQNQAYCRDKMNDILEKKISNANSCKMVRNMIDEIDSKNDNNEAKIAWQSSMSNTKNTLNSRFSKIVYDNKQVHVFDSASEKEIDQGLSLITDKIDSTFDPSKTTWNYIYNNNPKLVKFLNSHTRKERYHLEIFKCGKTSCSVCNPVRMPKEVWEEITQRPCFIPLPVPKKKDKMRIK